VDLVLLDIRLPGMDGLEVLERMKGLDEQLDVILITAVKTVRTAVSVMKLGALDYLTKLCRRLLGRRLRSQRLRDHREDGGRHERPVRRRGGGVRAADRRRHGGGVPRRSADHVRGEVIAGVARQGGGAAM
jgi:DNA-binding NtrC family response regulator